MRYIERDNNGNITGTFARPQFEGQESVPNNHPDILAMKTVNKEKEAEREMILKEVRDHNFQQAISRLKGKGRLISHH